MILTLVWKPPVFGLWLLKRLKLSGDVLFGVYAHDLDALGDDVSALELDYLEIGGVVSMLLGMALENLLKAIIISKCPIIEHGNKLRNWPKDGHDLISLAEKAGIPLDHQYDQILQRLTTYIRWAGRYPVPKKASQNCMDLPLQIYEKKLYDEIYKKLWGQIFSE